MTSLNTFAFVHPLTEAQLKEFENSFPGVRFLCANGRIPDGIEHAQALAVHWNAPPMEEILARASSAKWLHLRSTGIDQLRGSTLMTSDIVLTNGSGNHAPNIAEHVLAMMLAFARQLPRFVRAQVESRWVSGDASAVFEIGGQRLAIVGMGAIGNEIAKRAQALGMQVIAVRRDTSETPLASSYEEAVMEQLNDVLAVADHVALCLPLTPETECLFGQELFAKFKRGAFLYNVGRGPVVDHDALVTALDQGLLAGAGLDVTEPEPLPAESGLWRHENVLITGHSAGQTPRSYDRFAELVRKNIARYQAGVPLVNVVNKRAGY